MDVSLLSDSQIIDEALSRNINLDALLYRLTEQQYRRNTPQDDKFLAHRHMQYGPTLCALDIDKLLIERNGDRPLALIEYKRCNASAMAFQKASNRTVLGLGTRCGLPALVVAYEFDTENNRIWHILYKFNFEARESLRSFVRKKEVILPERSIPALSGTYLALSEATYIQWLYWLRQEEAPQNVLTRFM